MSLQTWIIEPQDSLIVRDAKPFGANITSATSLDFPFPSTTTGGVRTRVGLDENGIFSVPKDKIEELTNIEVRGPLLAEIGDNGEIKEFYLSSPADALLLQDKDQKRDKKAQLYRLLPLNFSDAITNLEGLLPVGLDRTNLKGKPFGELRYWKWEKLTNWLLDGKDHDKHSPINLANYGIRNLQKDSRTHVAINEYFASDEGNLFSTRGLEFNYGEQDLRARKFALVVFVDDKVGKDIENKGRLAPLGGERRLVSWQKSGKQHSLLNCPKEIKDQIAKDEHCRLMLLTPAYFTTGMPKSTDHYDIKAIACNRYQTVSGWDFEKNRPKPTRRLLPAGSVLFLNLSKNPDIQSWIENTWFSCIGDDEHAVKDGFGLCVLGTWNGKSLTEWR